MKIAHIFTYNPLTSFLHFVHLKVNRRIQYPQKNIGMDVINSDSEKYRIFLEIDILNHGRKKREGNAVFKIIFHSPRTPAEKIIKRTRFTIPFFSGLPGLCTKQFMVNEDSQKFSGRYEWETIAMAQEYARSFALDFMKRRSNPFPVYYEIIDKKDERIIESLTLISK